MKPKRSTLLVAALTAIVVCAASATAASASPVWKFNGSELSGKETLVGAAINSQLTVPGVITIECKDFLYNSKIWNTGGKGEGEITELPLFECSTNSANCLVEKIEAVAASLPWPGHLTTVGEKTYVVIGAAGTKEIKVNVTFGGKLCALSGTDQIKGTAGGLMENSTQTATFSKASFEATGTKLKFTATQPAELGGVFTVEAFESHRLQEVEVA